MSRTRRLERLMRIRRAERDRERATCRLRSAEAEQAHELARTADAVLESQTERFFDDSRGGASRAWWRAAFAGIGALRSRRDTAHDEAGRADAAEAEAKASLLEARRKLRGAERLAERARREDARAAARAGQKRLDDLAGNRHARARRALGLALVVCLGSVDARAETTAPVNPGVEMLVGEIRVRQAELDSRERELADREAHLEELEAEITARLDELEKITSAVEERIASWETAHEDKQLSRLAKIYGSMDPRTAARLLEDLELDLATRIIAKMKHKQSAALLPLISQPRALAMSRSVAHPLGNPALPSEKKK